MRKNIFTYYIISYLTCILLLSCIHSVLHPAVLLLPELQQVEDMETLWMYGITMTFYPGTGFQRELHLKWWELYEWSKKLKRNWKHWKEWMAVEVLPYFRW